ncbi:Serpin-Z10 [Camellia lanceoleosa]|uniref:Serpin-Z10 n=1 Tax=Camellia lanceoleosa TaxID=1840588 RepID=A0ACC0HS54_9ERIC|nr:Serpin-Z10 [Camellia lanceoleosa]
MLTHTNSPLQNLMHDVIQILEKKTCNGETTFVCSPLSLNATLNMVAAVTKGRTLEKYLDFLGLKSVENVNSISMKIMDVTCKRGPSQNITGDRRRDLIISFVNGAWASKCFPIVHSYLELLSRVYNAESKVVDFQNKADEVVDEVNSWAKAATRGLITNILKPKSLSPDIAIILANGLYFKGTWSREFDAKYTKNRDFYILNGDTVSVLFMTNHHDKYLYGSCEGFKVLKIWYQSGNGKAALNPQFAMYLFLPDVRDRLQDLLREFESNPGFSQKDLRSNMDLEKLDEIWIPKFKFSYDFDVCGEMLDMGHSLPTNENPRDFTEIIHVPNPKGIPVFVTNMFHKAFIEVDEIGTEAAAISIYIMDGCAMSRIEHPSFIANHPFFLHDQGRDVRVGSFHWSSRKSNLR